MFGELIELYIPREATKYHAIIKLLHDVVSLLVT